MKKTKEIIAFAMSLIVLVCSPMSVNAETISCNEKNEQQIMYEKMTSKSIVLPENVGETKIVEQDEYGTLTVTLVESWESKARGTDKTARHAYSFQYTTILGVKEEAYTVSLTCNWTEDGEDSKINNLQGTYQEIAGGYSCEWTDSTYGTNHCMLELKVSKAGVGTGYYVFSAILSFGNPKKITFSYALI